MIKRLMDNIRNWFNNKVKKRFNRSSPSSPPNRIEVHRRTDSSPMGRLEVRGRTDTTMPSQQSAAGGGGIFRSISPVTQAVPQSEDAVMTENQDSGGIVHRRGKPTQCPQCRTRGCVIENPVGRPKWKCTNPVCDGYTFDG